MTNFINILNNHERTHMPYVSRHGSDILYLFCIRINGIWKIHYVLNTGPCTRLKTGLDDETNECSPVGSYRNGEGWFVSFIAGASATSMQLKLYHMKLFDAESIIIRHAKVGFYVNDKQLAFGDFSSTFYFHNLTSATGCHVKNSVELLSLRPRVDGTFFLSYRNRSNEITSLWLSPAQKKVHRLTDGEGNSLYKMCEWDSGAYYAIKCGEDFEDRKVVFTSRIIKEVLDFDDCFELFTVRGSLEETVKRHMVSDILNCLPEGLR